MKKIIPILALFVASCTSFSDKKNDAADILKQDFALLKSTAQSFEMSDQDKAGILLTDSANQNNAAYLISDTSGTTAQFDENHISAAYIKTPDDRFKKGAVYFHINKVDDTTYRAGVLHPVFARFPLKKDVPPQFVNDTIDGQVYIRKTMQSRIGIWPVKGNYRSFNEAAHDVASKSSAVSDAVEKVLKRDQPQVK